MKHAVLAGLLALTIAGCGGGQTSTETTSGGSDSSAQTSVAASGCTASGLDAMSVLADFQLEMGEAQKSGKLTVDQLTAARDKLYNATQAAQAKDDWTSYCKAIDDMRAELGL